VLPKIATELSKLSSKLNTITDELSGTKAFFQSELFVISWRLSRKLSKTSSLIRYFHESHKFTVSSEFPKFAVSILSLVKVYKSPYLIRSSNEFFNIIQAFMSSEPSEFSRVFELSELHKKCKKLFTLIPAFELSKLYKIYKTLKKLFKVSDEFSLISIELAGLIQARSNPLAFRPSELSIGDIIQLSPTSVHPVVSRFQIMAFIYTVVLLSVVLSLIFIMKIAKKIAIHEHFKTLTLICMCMYMMALQYLLAASILQLMVLLTVLLFIIVIFLMTIPEHFMFKILTSMYNNIVLCIMTVTVQASILHVQTVWFYIMVFFTMVLLFSLMTIPEHKNLISIMVCMMVVFLIEYHILMSFMATMLMSTMLILAITISTKHLTGADISDLGEKLTHCQSLVLADDPCCEFTCDHNVLQSLALADVSFIDEVCVHTCDHYGVTLSKYDVQVLIPPGAVPKGAIVHIEMGVALYGPYKFPDGYQPVSPILWFCIREDVELLIPVVYTLPHVITNIDSVNLKFVKAKRQTHKNHFDFEVLPSADMHFKIPGYGSLTSKHACFLCIAAGNSSKVTKNLALKKGYCLHFLIKRIDSSSYRILLICTYFLETCFEVSTVHNI
jgi:hypothetical protein